MQGLVAPLPRGSVVASRKPKTFTLDALATAGAVMTGALLLLLGLLLPQRAFAEPATAPEEAPLVPGLYLLLDQEGRALSAPQIAGEIDIEVNGLVARATVRQTFRNPTEVWLTGIYVFPLPERSAVDRLAMTVGERRVEGRILEKKEAEKVFAAAAANGQRASLLSAERPNVFVSHVANIGPGEEIGVEIGFQDSVSYEEGRFSLSLPLTVAPRYTPGGAPLVVKAPSAPQPQTPRVQPIELVDPDAQPGDGIERDLFGPVAAPGAAPAPSVSISVRLDSGLPVARIESSSHDIVVESLDGRRQLVRLAAGSVTADRDFRLDWWPSVGEAPAAAIFGEEIDGDSHLLVMLLPPDGEAVSTPTDGEAAAAPQVTGGRELILVVDTSGSMAGPSMEQARAALLLALERLAPEDRFNIVRFASDVSQLFPMPQAATADNVRRAIAYSYSLTADGGTEMAPALRLALDQAERGARLRQIVFVTDGAVGNEEELFRLIDGRLGATRLFTVGIGSAPNGFFMRKAAEMGRGSFTLIDRIDAVEARMGELFQRLESPALVDLAAAWPAGLGAAESYPSPLPDLYHGQPVVLSVRVPGKALAALSGTLAITGQRGGAPLQLELPLDGLEPAAGVASLWARAKLEAIEDSGRVAARAPNEVRAEALALALAYDLVSHYTSLIAVDEEVARPAGAEQAVYELPRALPAGWSFDKVFGEAAPPPDAMRMRASRLPPAMVRQAVAAAESKVALPQTATPATLKMLLGAAALLFAVVLLLLGRRFVAWQR
ncbi:MAG: marine proteobacterial sortase target protein [Kiloniellales bacterium]